MADQVVMDFPWLGRETLREMAIVALSEPEGVSMVDVEAVVDRLVVAFPESFPEAGGVRGWVLGELVERIGLRIGLEVSDG